MTLPTLSSDFLAALAQVDSAIAAAVQKTGCPACGGPLYQSNYQRKGRGGGLVAVDASLMLRHSLCCGREGCRKRTLPPSLRFFGRRVYLTSVILFASAWARVCATLQEASARTAVPPGTLGQWRRWWVESAPGTDWWRGVRARMVPPPDEASLPLSLLERLRSWAPDDTALAWLAGRTLAPGSTRARIDVVAVLRGFPA